MMMSLFQVPAVVALFLTWFTAPPASFAEASRREALRRVLIAPSAKSLNDNNLPDMPPSESAMAAAASAAKAQAVAAELEDPKKPAAAAAPASGAAAPSAGASTNAPVKQDEAAWRGRITTAREQLSQDQFTREAMQTRFNSLTTDFVNRDDPAQRAKIEQDRTKAMSELKRLEKQIAADEKAIGDIQEEARKLNVPASWVR